MKISIIVEHNIEKSTQETLEDIVKMINVLSERYPSIIEKKDAEVTITV